MFVSLAILKEVGAYSLNSLFAEFVDWKWDPTTVSPSVALTHGNREVMFHPDYSCGTAAVRGSTPLGPGGEHYWEIKMTSAVYGTDMVGVQG